MSRVLTVTLPPEDDEDDGGGGHGGGSASPRELSVRLTADGLVADHAGRLGGAFEAHPHALDAGGEAAWRALEADCEAVFAADGSFWLAHGAAPRCALEALVRDVYAHHARGLPAPRAGEIAGAEWWSQVRRAPAATSRASPRLAAAERAGVALHWDKDEALVDEGGPTVHPFVSTVTYVAGGDGGAPTIVVPLAPLDKPKGASSRAGACFVSYPRRGKSIAFDGRWLHGAPVSLMRGTAPEGTLRITLLVNVWRGWRPLGVEPLPAAAVAELGLAPASAARPLGFLGRAGARVAPLRGGGGGDSSVSSFRFGAEKRGEWLLSLPLPRAALEASGEDTLRVEYAVGDEGAVLLAD